jgi:hypothetical protein
MRLRRALPLAALAASMTGSLALAQTTPSAPQSETRKPQKTQSPPAATQYPGGAHKQSTQGLPPGLAPNTAAPWNNQNQPATKQQ